MEQCGHSSCKDYDKNTNNHCSGFGDISVCRWSIPLTAEKDAVAESPLQCGVMPYQGTLLDYIQSIPEGANVKVITGARERRYFIATKGDKKWIYKGNRTWEEA